MTAADFYRASKGDLETEFKRQKPWTEHESVTCIFKEGVHATFMVIVEDNDGDHSWNDCMIFEVSVNVSGAWTITQLVKKPE